MATTQQLTAQQLALYIGQLFAIIFEKSGTVHDFMNIDLHSLRLYNKGYGHGVAWRNKVWGEAFTQSDLDYIWKPILRRLDSITEEEARELYKLRYPLESWEGESALNDWWLEFYEFYIPERLNCLGCPSAWLYLLSIGIDLFGWIDAGLAIDKATIENK